MSKKRGFSALTHTSAALLEERKNFANVLCCVCGISMQPTPSGTCLDCLKNQVDITQDICRQGTVTFCRECNRYQKPGGSWCVCELESRELLAVCLKKVKGLESNGVKLVDAGFIWTEPNSKRLKLKLTVQKEVVNGAVMQQSLVIELIVHYMQCEDCQRTYTPHVWNAIAQVRQKTEHKRTFFFLEQLILKHNAHEKVVSIKNRTDGLDFHFGHRMHAQRFVDFVSNLFPTKMKLSKHLVSHDSNNNTYNYKYAFQLDICPVCKDDLVFLPKEMRSKFGGLPEIMLCTKVSTTVHLFDPATGKSVQVPAVEYWKYPFESICNRKHLSEWLVLNVEDGPDGMVEIAKSNEVGISSRFIRQSASKFPLFCGDLLLCYDLQTINLSGSDETVNVGNVEVVVVRKTAGAGRNASARPWVLKTLVKHNDDKEEAINNKMGDDNEVEDFKRELEDDPEMRREINIYRKPKFAVMETEEAPVVDLSEMLEGLTLNDKEDTL